MGIHDGHRHRKREQFLRNGLDGFADHETLELLLFYAIPRKDTNELAHNLLEYFGSLRAVLSAPAEELERWPCIGENAAALLKLVPAIYQRSQTPAEEEQILNSVENTGRFFMRVFQGVTREVLLQACLDAKGRVLCCKKLSEGGVNQATTNIRTIMENAIFSGASGVILSHNHPSGIALPSREDVTMTLQVRNALQTVDVELVDHVIVADNDFVSMAANGTLFLGGSSDVYSVF